MWRLRTDGTANTDHMRWKNVTAEEDKQTKPEGQ